MKLLTDLVPHLLFCGFIFIACLFGLALLVWVIGLTVLPFHWVITKFTDTKCPECKGFFKKRFVGWEVIDEREVLRTISRVDQGLLYSNHFLEPDQIIEVSRKERVAFTEKTILNKWECKNPLCGYKWETEEYSEEEAF